SGYLLAKNEPPAAEDALDRGIDLVLKELIAPSGIRREQPSTCHVSATRGSGHRTSDSTRSSSECRHQGRPEASNPERSGSCPSGPRNRRCRSCVAPLGRGPSRT